MRNILIAAALICMLSVTSCAPQGVTSHVSVDVNSPQLVDITMEGGSGKAHIESPVEITYKDGEAFAKLVWSSKYYDYVIVDGIRYDNENPGGYSTFTVPVGSLDEPLSIIGDTVAMSTPHEIEYTITWNAKDTAEEPGADKDTESEFDGNFTIKEYGDCRLISINGVGDHILVPEGVDVPADIPEDVTVIKQPLDKTYLVSTSVMDLLRQIGSLDMVRFSGLEADDWYIEDAAKRIKDGQMLYAGKYRAPDYELLLSQGCNLAIENTMIYHDPEVKEKLEELGIPVLVETSSYTKDPLARLSWIKLYGVLFGKEKEADDFYNEQAEKIKELTKGEASHKKVAVFYVSATGMINVRVPGDYLTSMIEMAGGEYVPDKESAGSESGMGTLNMQMEDFYTVARDADILIYNGTIDGDIVSVRDLVAKNELFSDMKAVREGNVYCLRSDFFQKSTKTTELLEDLAAALQKEDRDFSFLIKVTD